MAIDSFPALVWRIRPIMVERDIHTVRELRRRLKAVGYDISEPQLGRVRKALPRQLDTRLLAALCAALEVQPGDLLAIRGHPVRVTTPAGHLALSSHSTSNTGSEQGEEPSPAAPPAPCIYPSTGPKVGRLTQLKS